MSKFLDVNELNIDDQDVLVATLEQDMRYRGAISGIDVESHEEAQHLYGYAGDMRAEVAEVIVRRHWVGGLSNDIGFKRQESGNFKPIISQYDSHHYNDQWIDKLSYNYAQRKYEKEMLMQGFILQNKTVNTDGTVDMQFIQQGAF
jgi:hypothetical protein